MVLHLAPESILELLGLGCGFWMESGVWSPGVLKSEIRLEAPGTISFRFAHQNYQEINRKSAWKLLAFPVNQIDKESIGKGPGSFWNHFL